MPYSMCPVCGNVMHLGVVDVRAWYAERHPDAEFGSLVPEVCMACHGELNVGQEVYTRVLKGDNMEVAPGLKGVIVRVLGNRERGHIYIVRLDSGQELTVPRQALSRWQLHRSRGKQQDVS